MIKVVGLKKIRVLIILLSLSSALPLLPQTTTVVEGQELAQDSESMVFGNPTLPNWQNITVTVATDGKSFTIDNADNLTWTFWYGTNKYNSIYENGVQIVKDEMWFLWNEKQDNDPHSLDVIWEQPQPYNVKVTQFYSSKSGDYNVTWDFYGGFRAKISLIANLMVGSYTVDWRTYVYKDFAESKTNCVKFWNEKQEAIVFDYTDVFEGFGNITEIEGVEGWVKGKRFDLIFNVGPLEVGGFSLDPNFGYEEHNTFFQNYVNYVRGSVFTITEDGIADNITAYVGMWDYFSAIGVFLNVHAKASIYEHSDLSFVGETEELYTKSGDGVSAWVTWNFNEPKPSLTADTAYILDIWGKNEPYSTQCRLYYDVGDTDQGHYDAETYNSFPDPLEPVHNTDKYSIYCGYTEVVSQYTCTFYFYNGGTLLVNGTSKSNGTSTVYDENTVLNITGVPNAHYHFKNHTYDASSTTNNPFYLTVTQNYTVKTYFEIDTHKVTFYFNIGGSLKVNSTSTSNATTNYYTYNTVINITAITDYKYQFNNHTYDSSSTTNNPFYLTVIQNYTTYTYFRCLYDCNYIGVNNTISGKPIKLSSNWEDLYNAEGLSKHLYSDNRTGSWQNETAWSSTWISTTWAVKINSTLSLTAGQVMAFKFFVNDSSGTEYVSTICFFTVLSDKVDPVARFNTTIRVARINEVISFNGSMSLDPDGGSLTNYEWNFGDGNTTSGNYPTITHKWTSVNIYIINLTVTDDESATDSFIHTINITDYLLPIARFNTTITTAYVNQSISFDASMSSDPDGGSITNYEWNFGDSNTTSGNYPTISHSWSANGSYTINLTVTDDESATNSFTHMINITDYCAPIARFTFSPSDAETKETITFDASVSTDPDGSIASYSWTFGDGGTNSNQIVYKSYASKGTYTVNLTVTDDQGLTDNFVQIVIVEEADKGGITPRIAPDFDVNILKSPRYVVASFIPFWTPTFTVEGTIHNKGDFQQEITVEYKLENDETDETVWEKTESFLMQARETRPMTVSFPVPSEEDTYKLTMRVIEPKRPIGGGGLAQQIFEVKTVPTWLTTDGLFILIPGIIALIAGVIIVGNRRDWFDWDF